VEDAVRLCGVHVPDELSVYKRSCWAHHAVDPFLKDVSTALRR
jgi:hypothetical protein